MSIACFICQVFSNTEENQLKTVYFDVPEGKAISTLKEAARQADVDIVFAGRLLRKVETPAVQGEYVPKEVFDLMLAGASLAVFQHEKSGVYTIRKVEIAEDADSDSTPEKPTPMNEKNKKNGGLLKGLLAIALAGLPSGYAQEADGDEVFTLSPFTVAADEDEGYRSENTLAGTRLNSSLKDSAAAISVYNAEFLSDLAAVDDAEALLYSINSELDFEESGARAAGGNQMLEFAGNFKIRGLRASRGRNFFAWDLSMDSYNTERFDESRGPNSVLFGLGSPGGILNTYTKKASVGRDFGEVGFQFGSYDLIRGTLDLNKVLVEDKLAVRLNAMQSDENGYRNFAFKEKYASHVALTYIPSEKVTFRAEYEKGNTFDNRARNETAYDEFTTWHLAGSPVTDTSGLTDPANNPDKATLQGARDRDVGVWNSGSRKLIYVNNTGDTFNARNYLTTDTQGAKSGSLVFEDGFRDEKMNLTGPAAIRQMPFETYTATLELNPVKDLFFELSFNKLDAYFQNWDPASNSLKIFGDPNSHHLLLDGTEAATPALYYNETNWITRGRDQDIDSLRATGSYSFELGEGRLGRHQLGFLYEKIDEDFSRREAREVLDQPLLHANPEHSNNRVNRRQYFNAGQYDQMYTPGREDITFVIDGQTVGTRFVPGNSSGSFDDVYTTESHMAVLQSFWFNDRVVTTVGHRQDERTLAESGAFRDAVTNIWTIDAANPDIIIYKPSTTTFGVVGHINDQVSVLFNKSTSVTLANTNMRVAPDWNSPNPSDNEGMDVGFNFSLLENKVNLRATYFESEADDTANYSAAARFIRNANNRAYSGLNQYVPATEADALNRPVSDEELDSLISTAGAHYYDREASGYELRMNANFTKNWSLLLNASQSNLVETDIMSRLTPKHEEIMVDVANRISGFSGSFADLAEADFQINGAHIPSSSSSKSVYGAFFDPNQSVDTAAFYKSFEGREAYGNREHKFNAFTRYKFSEGRLKGAFVGGGYRWQSGRVNDVDLATGELGYSADAGVFDLLFGYRTKVWEGKELSFQLNVQNALDDDTFHDLRYDRSGEVLLRGYFQAPRTYRFTTRLKF